LNDEIRTDSKRFLFYGLWLVLSFALFWKPCLALVRFSIANDNASHVVLMPFISVGLIYIERKTIFRRVSFDYSLAGFLFAISAVAYIWTLRSASSWTPPGMLAGYVLAMVLLWLSGFALCFGREALKNGRFPLLLLFLTIPLPDVLLNQSIYFLQKGSTDVAEIIFRFLRVPALRDGFVFHIGHFDIEVSRECSGIRSSLALLILTLIAGHLFLRAFWKQIVLVIAGLLMMVIKNGIRIATLTILGNYVDPGFLTGSLHHKGGVIFFLIGLGLLWPVFWLLKRGEENRHNFAISM